MPEGSHRSQADMIYAVAARKSRILEIIDLVQGAELALSAIDIPELAMMNLARESVDDTEGLAFLDLREDGSTLNLSRAGEIHLTRHLSTRVDDHIMNSREWESIRERLVLEIQRSLDYYQSQMGQTMVPKIVLAPRADNAEMLARELGMAMSLNVENMDISGFLREVPVLGNAFEQNQSETVKTELVILLRAMVDEDDMMQELIEEHRQGLDSLSREIDPYYR